MKLSVSPIRSAVVGGILVGIVLALVSRQLIRDYGLQVRSAISPSSWHYSELEAVRVERCRFVGLPDDTVVHAVAVDRGDLIADIAPVERPSYYARAVEIFVTRRDAPVLLVLSGKESVVWEVAIDRGVKLAGVVAVGRSAPALIGIPRSVPHLVINQRARIRQCPPFDPGYVHGMGGSDFGEFNDAVRQMTGRDIRALEKAYRGARFFIGPNAEDRTATFLRDDEMRTDYFLASDTVRPGEFGVLDLIRRGKIRRANDEDITAWIDGAKLALAIVDPPTALVQGADKFVILDRIELPNDLSGHGYITLFLLPVDVPEPAHGNDATIYRMRDYSCTPEPRCLD